MIFQQGGNSFDITLYCMSTIGVFLFISYVVFAYWVTHRGDFYHIRRWKAALWFAGIFAVIPLAFLLFPSISAIVSNAAGKNTYEVILVIFGVMFSTFALISPFLFILTIGMHHQLKVWLTSDDHLDKIWRDPNKGNKSPIQEL